MSRACPYCHSAVSGAGHACPVCSTRHHTDCWAQNEGCAVPLCEAGPKLPYLGPASLGHHETEAESRRTAESGERITIELDAFPAAPTPQRPASPPRSPASRPAPSHDSRKQERPFLRRGLLITASLGIAVTGAALALAMTRPDDKPAGPPTTQTQPTELHPGSKEQADNRTETMIEDAREQAKSLRSQDRRSQAAIPAGTPATSAPRAVPDPPLSAPPATRAEPAPDPGGPPGADAEDNGAGGGAGEPQPGEPNVFDQ